MHAIRPAASSFVLVPLFVFLGVAAGAPNDSYCPDLCLPDTVHAVVGRTLTIRYDQISPQIAAAASLLLCCEADSGVAGPEAFLFEPHAPGSTTVTISVRDSLDMVVAVASTEVSAVDDDSGRGTCSVLFVGDSLVAAHPAALDSAYIVTAVRAAFERDGGGGIRLLGTAGAAPSLHEGYPGRRWLDFTSPTSAVFSNPFWNEATDSLDFQHYMTVSAQQGPIDYCMVQLGYNDLYGLLGAPLTESVLAVWLARIDSFCRAMLSPTRGYPGCRLVLCLPSSGNIRQSAWIDNYGSLAGWEAYETNIAIYRSALRGRYDRGTFDPRVSVCSTGLSVDRLLGYPVDNYLHPNRTGYAAMAEAMYAHLRALRRLEAPTVAVPPSAGPHPDLSPCCPNPFNPVTSVEFSLPTPAWVRLAVYDLRGARVATLWDRFETGGGRQLQWNGRRTDGAPAPAGVYFLRLEAAGTVMTRRAVLIR